MFHVCGYTVYPEQSELLFHDDFSERLSRRWDKFSGGWTIRKGVLTGLMRENRNGLVYLKNQFPGDVMLDFYGRLNASCEHELNCIFRAGEWDEEFDDAGVGYLVRIGGFKTGRTGIEKYPNRSLRVMTGLFSPKPGQEYHIQAGIIEDCCFVAVDGTVIVEMQDPEPILHPARNLVGLGVCCSRAAFKDFKVFRPKWEKLDLSYPLMTF